MNWKQGLSISQSGPSNFQFVVGTPYSAGNSISFQAVGGTSPYTWSATGFPPGLSINTGSGLIIGTPTQPGTFPVGITVTDSSNQSTNGTFNLVVATTPLLITNDDGSTPPALPLGTVGTSYTRFLTAQGGSQSLYTWNTQGTLPPGLTAQNGPGCPAACALKMSGTPTQAGTFNFTVQVKDSLNNTAQRSFSLIINSGTPPQITSTTLPRATVGQSYSFPFAASGGSGSGYQWSFVGSGPDSGLQLSAGGVLSGTSNVANDCDYVWGTPATFQVKVTDSAGQSNSKQFCLTAFYPAPQITGVNPAGVVVDGQSHTITVSGNNIRNDAQVYTGPTLLATTFSGGALSFTLMPGSSGRALGPLNEGSSPLRIVQPFTDGSNADKTLSIYDPVPTMSSVNAVLNNSSQPCTVNLSCQLVVNGSGLVYVTTYTVVQTGTSLSRAVYPSTPVPWNTITTSAFSVTSPGTYTLRVTNPNQSGGGSASVEMQFSVAP